MKRKQLRACFERIRPREELVEQTLARLHECQAANAASVTRERREPRYAFATRLAGAMCALLLVVGVGVVIGRETFGTPDIARHTPGAQASDGVDWWSLSAEQEMAMRMRAEAEGGEWVIVLASVDAVKTQNEICTASVEIKSLCAWSENAKEMLEMQLPRTLTMTDATSIDAAYSGVGTVMALRLHLDGNGTWVPAEIAPPDRND